METLDFLRAFGWWVIAISLIAKGLLRFTAMLIIYRLSRLEDKDFRVIFAERNVISINRYVNIAVASFLVGLVVICFIFHYGDTSIGPLIAGIGISIFCVVFWMIEFWKGGGFR